MGVSKDRRPVLHNAGGTVRGQGTTFESDLVFSSTVSTAVGPSIFTEAVTLGAALSTLAAQGVSFVTNAATATGSGRGSVIPDPPRAGALKKVVVDNQTTSLQVAFHLATTGASFFGTTNNTATVAVDSTDTDQIPWLHLVGRTTDQWALDISSTNHWTLSESTGSTGLG